MSFLDLNIAPAPAFAVYPVARQRPCYYGAAFSPSDGIGSVYLSMNWSSISDQVIATILATAILGLIAIIWTKTRKSHRSEASTDEVSGTLLHSEQRTLASPPRVDLGDTELQVLAAFSKYGSTLLPVQTIQQALGVNEIRLSEAIDHLVAQQLARLDRGNWVQMRPASLELTPEGRRDLLARGMA